jgi:long-chain acyl-CoA synthetase
VYESGGQLKAVIVPDADEMRARGVANIAENLRWEIEALSGGLPPQMRIKGYELRSEPLPRTPLGKLRRFMVHAARAEADLKERPDDPAFADEAGRAVREGLRALLPPGTPVRGEDNIELDLGVDSLMRLELAVSVERALGIKIPSEVAVHAHTVAELADGVRTLEASAGAGAALGGSAEGMDAVLEAEPTERELVEAGMDGTRFWPLAAAVVLGLKVLMRVVYRMEVRGAHNIPAPPFILAPNHVSFIDAPVLAAGVPLGVLRNLRFLGIEKYFRTRVMKFGGRTLGVIRIDPDAHLSHAMKLSAAAIRGGNSLVIFPEGGRSFDGRLMPFKKGVGILSLKLGVPVVPVRIDGAHDALPRGARFLRPARIRLTIGTPIAPAMPEGVADPAQAMADRVRAVIEAMGR